MIQADDIDEDYFIPSNSSTLANIFSSASSKNSENSSLKYVSPKPSVSTASKLEDSKTSECIFACSLQAFEWHDNIYTPRGKVGFAIVKMIKSGNSNILLYDANKSTLSCATVQSSLHMKLKDDTYLLYYDNADKYWCLYGTDIDMKSIVNCLGNLNCIVAFSPLEDKKPLEPAQFDHSSIKQSDTDSSMSKKTKQTILSRMATMGQSVLPPQPIMAEKTSDSSDNNEDNECHKIMRHKASKIVHKKATDKEPQILGVPNFDPESIFHSNLSDRQLLPIIKSDIISNVSVSQDLSILMSEQRQSNSELRIKIGRLTDKMDKLLEKVNNMKHIDKPGEDFQTAIYQKLLVEYEKKIVVYEDLIKSKGLDKDTSKDAGNVGDEIKNLQQNKSKLAHTLCAHEVLEEQISKKNYMESRSEQLTETVIKQLEDQNIDPCTKAAVMNCNVACEREKFNLIKQIHELNRELSKKEVELLNCKSACDKLIERNRNIPLLDLSIGAKVKSVVNDIFQSIAANFNDDETYLGAVVKNTAATVIKEVTLETLKTM